MYETEVTEKIPQQIVRSLESPQGVLPQSQVAGPIEKRNSEESESSYNKPISPEQTGQLNPPAITINKYVLSSLIDDSYSKNTVCVFVQVTNIGKEALQNIDLYEIVPQDMDIINCSIPVKTGSMSEIIKYVKLNSNPLFYEDISNPRKFAKSLTNNDLLSQKLMTYFSENDWEKLKNNSDSNTNILVRIILKGLNNAIVTSGSDYPVQFNKDLDKIYSLQTKRLLEFNKSSQLKNIDRYLLNLLQLRDLYPSYINKPDENFNILEIPLVDNLTGYIHFSKFDLNPKESLMYIYYANLFSQDIYKTSTNFRVPDSRYSDFNYPLFVTFSSPQFNVKVDLSELEVQPGDEVILTYIVDFLNPINTSSKHMLNARIEKSGNNIYINKSIIKLNFSKDKTTSEGAISLNFSKPGTYNIPALEIDDKMYSPFGGNIEVEALWHRYIAELSLIFLALCTVVASNLHNLLSKNVLQIFYIALFFAIVSVSVSLLEFPSYLIFVFFIFFLLFVINSLVDLSTRLEEKDQSKP